MSLVRAERRRLHKRRVTVVMLAIGVILLGLIAGGTWFSNHKVSDATRAAAVAQAEQEYQRALDDWNSNGKKRCEDDVKAGQIPAEACQGPKPDYFLADYYMPSTFVFKAGFRDMLTVWAMIMAFVALVIGASSIGAEWSSGSMMNLLTWQPRRVRVLGTKLGVLLAVTAFWSLVVGALWTAAMWATAVFRGTTAGMTSGTWQSFALTGLRGLGVVAAAAVFGFVLASLGRRTAVAMGVLIALIVVTQFGLTILLFMAKVRYPEMFFVGNHLQAWMNGSVTMYDQTSCDFSAGMCQPQQLVLTWQRAGTIFGAGLLALVGLSMWQIRARDVA
ncbi:MAG: ABC transporter permease subunit [Hamadaea sp.]|uniref:ABC transporter permease subunit n=1 Tax=Hamadaea sp. TaxID=2024425 RepID=UPI001799B271|nr:ABC transporter permease subunit [Hamadaea sp.]NUR73050.1 ABC transporter permease subunit [Hamadaea sp.]NUT20374.1 ABC transporter permease subunit [Hamadaea sp.]